MTPPIQTITTSFLRYALLVAVFGVFGSAMASPKKGICQTTGKDNAKNWKVKVAAQEGAWHYSWGSQLPEAQVEGVEFVPMIWGYWGASDGFLKEMARLKAAGEAGEITTLLGFNEPDNRTQANLSVRKAIEAWPHLEATGLRLGSPAGVHADNKWMRAFMKEAKAKNLRIDFVTVHWYGGLSVDSLINHLHKIHKLYGKPIWITEFCPADWRAKSRNKNYLKPEKVAEFMKEALPRLDALPFVEKYTWFSAHPDDRALGPSSLLHRDGTLTELGKVYAAHQASGDAVVIAEAPVYQPVSEAPAPVPSEPQAEPKTESQSEAKPPIVASELAEAAPKPKPTIVKPEGPSAVFLPFEE